MRKAAIAKRYASALIAIGKEDKFHEKYGSELAKVEAGRSKFLASTSAGTCPSQSVIENVPNSEK